MRAWIGKTLVGVGVIHSLFGLVFMRSTLAILWSEGLLNAVTGPARREGGCPIARGKSAGVGVSS